jgi:tetratricopeptide (TPR) repeat protein
VEHDLDGWNLAARRLLQRLRQPGSLELDVTGGALRDAMETGTVHDAVRVCVERALAHADPRLTTIVRRCDLGGETTKAVARDLHMSMRNLFRFRATIFAALAAEMRRAIESRVAVPRDELRAEAVRLLTRCEFVLARMAPGDDLRAIALAERALEADPSLATAWCAIASASMSLALRSAVDPRTAYARAAEALERADALAPRSGAVTGLRASLLLWTQGDDRGERLAEEALATQAGAARGHYTLGWVATRRGEFDDAERHFAAATIADPRNAPYHGCAMAVIALRGDFARCVERCRELHDIEPFHPYTLGYYAESLNAAGRYAETRDVVAAAPDSARNFTVTAALARAHMMLGDRDSALAIAHAFRGPAVSCAAIALTLGEEDRAWRALERAREEPNGMLELTPFDRVFQPLWEEPRFRALVS